MNEKFKLMRRPENNSNWEILIIASLDTCKEYQEEDYTHLYNDMQLIY
jgi:hypothetical protein